MGVNDTNHWNRLISSCNVIINNKEAENNGLEEEENAKKKEEQSIRDYLNATGREFRRAKNKLYSFLRENGTVFSMLNEEQQAQYNQLLAKKNSLGSIFNITRDSLYSTKSAIVSLSNRQMSNYGLIRAFTEDKGDYIRQKTFYENYVESSNCSPT